VGQGLARQILFGTLPPKPQGHPMMYCKGCHYDKKDRLAEKAYPSNELYWDFFVHNLARLSSNLRLSIVYRQLA